MFSIKIFKFILVIVFISFFCTVVLSLSGYYQTTLQKQTILTNEAINMFENDLKEGKDIDINNYIEINKKDYDNAFSQGGRYISSKINKIVSTGISKALKLVISAIEE